LIGAELRLPLQGVSPLSETLILLRYVELHSRLRRLISVFKVRDGPFDPTIREFSISDAGIDIGHPFQTAEAVLSGLARGAARTAAEGGGPPPPPDRDS
jgi:circadian clock protein KaiC